MSYPSGYYPQENAVGTVDEDNASLQLIPVLHGDRQVPYEQYLYIEKISFSVHKAAIGGTGVCTIQTNEGVVVWTIGAAGITNFTIDWGEEGVKVGIEMDPGLQAVVSGAGTQASVSVGITAHYNRE